MVVYVTTNLISGKKYIGMDTRNNPRYLGSGKDLVLDIQKQGKENFKKEILEVCSSKEELSEREIYWIKYFNAKDSEEYYNLIDTKTPMQKSNLSQEHKDAIGNANRGKKKGKQPEEVIQKAVESRKKRAEERGYYHSTETVEKIRTANKKPKSEEHRKKLGEVQKGQPKFKKRVTVEKIDKHTKEVMKVYKGIKTVAEDGYNYSAVQNCCAKNKEGKEHTSGGFIWKYTEGESLWY